MPKYFLSCLY